MPSGMNSHMDMSESVCAALQEFLPATLQKIGVLDETALVMRLARDADVRYFYCAPHPSLRACAYGEASPGCRYPDAHWMKDYITTLKDAQLLRAVKVSDENVIECIFSPGIKIYIHYFGAGGNALLVDADGYVRASWRRSKSHPLGERYARRTLQKKDEQKSAIQTLSIEELCTQTRALYLRTLQEKVDAYHARALKKCMRRLEKIEEDARQAACAEEYRHKGELLTAHYHLLTRGMKEVTVTDYRDPSSPQMRIELDPSLTPQDNIARYFSLAKKWERAPEKIAERRRETREEIAQLTAQRAHAAATDDPAVLEKCLPSPTRKKTPKKQQKKSADTTAQKIRSYTTDDGHILYAGRNARENDYVSIRLAHGNDIWMHTRNRSGAHVIMRTQSKDTPSPHALREMAALCAYLSGVGDGERVEVMWTRAKHVSKPRHAKPGLVYVAQGKTIEVRNNAAAMKEWIRAHVRRAATGDQ